MTYRVIFAEAAQRDLHEIAGHLRDNAGDAIAAALTEKIIDAAESLRIMPTRQRVRRNLGSELRALSVGNYIIFYRVADEMVSIMRILHGSRNITPNLFS